MAGRDVEMSKDHQTDSHESQCTLGFLGTTLEREYNMPPVEALLFWLVNTPRASVARGLAHLTSFR